MKTLAVVAALFIGAATTALYAGNDATAATVVDSYGAPPLAFEANRGQTDPRVTFLARAKGSTLFLTPRETVLALRNSAGARVLRMTFLGATPKAALVGHDELPGRANYFIGRDARRWRANVPTYARVRQRGVYPGIDVVYYGDRGRFEYDVIVNPGADPRKVAISLGGADALTVDAEGDLVIRMGPTSIRQRKPVAYQEIDGARRQIASRYRVTNGRRVSFEVATYDRKRPLVIDPALFYSTYLGGSGYDQALAITVDGAGHAYVAGHTTSIEFPLGAGVVTGAAPGGNPDVFVAKINPTGSALVYSTYLVGMGLDSPGFGNSIAVDAAGNAYVIGVTASPDFPTTPGAVQPAHGGANDVFVAKLNGTGSALLYATYLGGRGNDIGQAIAIDTAGHAYVAGSTDGETFPVTASAVQRAVRGSGGNAFIAKLTPSGSALIYSTLLGGGQDSAIAIAVDAGGDAAVTGWTASTSFPTTAGAVQAAFGGEPLNAFVARLDPTGSTLLYSTYLGGSRGAVSDGIALDAAGNTYVTGKTSSTDFPTTAGAFQTNLVAAGAAFVTKLDRAGALVYSTYLAGSSGRNEGRGIAVDAAGNAHVTGTTTAPDFPTTPDAFQPVLAGDADVFVATLNPTATALVYSTFLGGSAADRAYGIALDRLPSPNAYVAGATRSVDFHVTAGAAVTTASGGWDAFIAKIAAVVLPGTSAGKIAGGGSIDVAGGTATFSFVVQSASRRGPIDGQLQYVNHATGATIHGTSFTTLTITGPTAMFQGTCTSNGAPCTFMVSVADNGDAGPADVFSISVSGGPAEGGTLRSGNIQVH